MEVQFSPEQEARLSEIANHAGMDAQHLVKDAALRLLEQHSLFRDGVQRGVAAADRGEFVKHCSARSECS